MTNEEAKKIIFYQWQDFLEHNIDYAGISEAYEMAIKALEQDKWIPVSERYPEEEGEEYLVCYDDGTIRIRHLYFTVADNEPYFEYGLGIVAWMSLPTQYTASPTGAEGCGE